MGESLDRMRGRLARIGFLWPADGLNDDEYWAFLPAGVAWLTARYTPDLGSEDLTLATVEAYASPKLLEQAVRLLLPVMPHVVACGDNAASVVNGLVGDELMRQAIERVAGVPATTPGAAILAATTRLGAVSLAVVSPYPPDLTRRLVAFFESAGHPVSDVVIEPESGEWGIGLAPPERWTAAAARLDRSRADAIVIAGGGVRMFGAIAGLEHELDRPVICAPAALVWHACQLAGLNVCAAGDGLLYSRFGCGESRTSVNDA